MEALETLCKDPNNIVMVITGLTKMKLGDTFKDSPKFDDSYKQWDGIFMG